MERLQCECSEYKLYSPDSLKYVTDNMHEILITKIKEYKKMFNIDKFEQLQINYFDDLDKFREFIYKLRGERETLPKYATGTFDDDMINAYIPNNLDKNSSKYKSNLYMASHELFHIMYRKIILKGAYSNRIVWYDEGMAQFMSGELDYLLNPSEFKNYYLKVKENTKVLPDLNSLKHGQSFCNNDYNGYDLSYLAIRYLYDTLNVDEFKNLMSNFSQIKNYGKIILSVMFNYYDTKILDERNKGK